MILADRLLGGLVGLAVGDALGGPAEGMEPEEIRERYGRIEGFVESPEDKPERWRLPGLHSDDTQQALIVAEAILESGRADPDVIVEKMVALSDGPRSVPFGAHRGTGRNFRFSVIEMRRGGRWDSASRNSAGIGASMRVAPVGLFFAGDDPATRENAALSALVTHNDPRGCLAACAVAYLAGQASRSRQLIDPEKAHRSVVEFIRRSEGWFMDTHGSRSHPEVRNSYAQFRHALEAIQGSWNRAPEKVLPVIAAKASELAGFDVSHPCRGFVLAGVISAIYFFLRYREQYRDALIQVVSAGGDTDSVGSIVGALCGAAAGESSIPQEWLSGLLGLEQIRLRALALTGLEADQDLWQPLAEYELQLTLEEDRQRREKFPEGTFPEEHEWEHPPHRSAGEESRREFEQEPGTEAVRSRKTRHTRRRSRPRRS